VEDNFIAGLSADWYGTFAFSTDANGALTVAQYFVTTVHDFVAVSASLNYGYFSDFGGNQEWGARGDWVLSRGALPPVPLPAGAPLLLIALGGLALMRRRTRQAITADPWNRTDVSKVLQPLDVVWVPARRNIHCAQPVAGLLTLRRPAADNLGKGRAT